MEMEQWGYAGNKKERRGRRAELPEDIAKKLKSCSVLGCEDWRDLSSYTTYHCFPTGDKNQARWEIWTRLLQRARGDDNWLPFRGSLICSHHFKPDDFVQDPNQKRRKLVKNAIPCVFPTFQVDLSDPSYAIEDSNDGDGTNNGGLDTAGGDSGYYYAEDEGYDYDDDQAMDESVVIPQVQVQYDDDDEDDYMDEEALQHAQYQAMPSKQKITNNYVTTSVIRSGPAALPKPPKLTPATHYGKSETETFSREPPQKKSAIMRPPLTFRGTLPSGTTIKAASNSHSNGSLQNSSGSHSKSSKLYEQLCQTIAANTKFPVSLNPDLEIEVVETNSPSEDSMESLKQRVENLELENESMRQKFENQIRGLRLKIREQEKTIVQYEYTIQALQSTNAQ